MPASKIHHFAQNEFPQLSCQELKGADWVQVASAVLFFSVASLMVSLVSCSDASPHQMWKGITALVP